MWGWLVVSEELYGIQHKCILSYLNIHSAGGRNPPKSSVFWNKYQGYTQLCPAALPPHFLLGAHYSPTPPRQLATTKLFWLKPVRYITWEIKNQTLEQSVLTVQKMLLKSKCTNHAADRRWPTQEREDNERASKKLKYTVRRNIPHCYPSLAQTALKHVHQHFHICSMWRLDTPKHNAIIFKYATKSKSSR